MPKNPEPPGTPAQLGFSMPAEWELHEATWLSWPYDPKTWPGKVPLAEQCMARWVREIVRDRPRMNGPERVEINVLDENHRERVSNILQDWDIPMGRVGLHLHPTADAWIRDYGPIFVTRRKDPGDGLGTVAITDWEFDTWGGKGEMYYGARKGLDNQIPWKIANLLGVPRWATGEVLEGGAIEVNGQGMLMAAADCLLTARKRSGSSQATRQKYLETILHDYLCAEHFLWLKTVAFEGDDTDGHIDNLARFTNATTIVTLRPPDKKDPLHKPLKANLKALEAARNGKGKPFDIVPIALPAAFRFRCLRDNGPERWRYPASYMNFYIANNAVLVPVYSDANDLPALEALQKCFPGRAVIGIDCCDYILGQGAIHCSTQQQPAKKAASR